MLDFGQPIALMLVAILHYVPDEWRPADILATLLDPLPAGSFLVASHISAEHDPAVAAWERNDRAAGIPAQMRDSGEFARLAFDGLELVEPGVVPVSDWRPGTPGPRPTPAEVSTYGGVARKA